MVVNQKITTTEKKIKAAFIYLVNEKGLSHVTVKDITESANINRSTFYKHFIDKPDLVNHYEEQFFDHVNKMLKVDNTSQIANHSIQEIQLQLYSKINKIIEYIYDELELAKALIGPNGDPFFEEKIKKLLRDILNTDLAVIKQNTKVEYYIPEDYAQEIVISELISIIKLWLTRSNPEPPQRISEIIIKTRYLNPHQLLGFNSSISFK